MPLHLDLFSGIGGFGLAANWAGYTTIGFCEVDPWCRRVLAKNWPEVPMYDDIKTLTGDIVRGWAGGQQVDLLTGGFPCQPVSVAGLRLGKEDDRYLWPEMLRLIADVRPARVLGENVAGIITMGLDAVLSDLEALGYTCWPVVIPAAAVGAPHRRDRVWILADAAARGVRRGGSSGQPGLIALGGEDVADTGSRQSDRSGTHRSGRDESANGGGVPSNAISFGQPGPGAREYASDQAPDRNRQAGDVVDAGAARTGPEAISSMGIETDGLPGRLAQSGWRVGPDVLNPWAGDWEGGIARTTTHEPDRANKLKALGNAVVPQIPYEILKAWGQIGADNGI